MDIKAYIESGILELYALDQLDVQEKTEVEVLLNSYPQLQEELVQIQDALTHWAIENAVMPTSYLANSILDQISNQEKERRMDLGDLPILNKYSNYEAWCALANDMKGLEPEQGQKAVRILRDDKDAMQLLVISECNIEEEVHAGELESFLILEGTCICTISGVQRIMGQGDYMEIPLYEAHDVCLTSNRVVAVLQHLKI